jgi:hypothetical protein
MTSNTRRFRLSLRTLLIVFTCLVCAVAWFAHYTHQRKAAFAAIRKAGGDIRMMFGKPSRLERWFGPESFGSVYKVDLRKGKVDNALLTDIGVLTELQKLDLSNAEIDDQGLRLIEHLPLRELWLQSTNITDASAATISKISTLDFLQLNATSLSDDFLKHLNSLPELQNLGLRGTEVTGSGMAFLVRHPKLKRLDVYSTAVDDSGVAHLVGCQSLTDVGLSMTGITDAVFKHLGELPKLSAADLTANRPITTDAVLAFEKAHPQCDIEWYEQ